MVEKFDVHYSLAAETSCRMKSETRKLLINFTTETDFQNLDLQTLSKSAIFSSQFRSRQKAGPGILADPNRTPLLKS